MTLHPILERAAEGELPAWARAGPDRMEHMRRVADLLEEWGEVGGLSEAERSRRRAAGYLHDALRDATPTELRQASGDPLPDLPEPVLHGPAAAARLRSAGVTDEGFLRAIAFHTIGHPDLGPLGRALYAADFLEPGRRGLGERRNELRSRMPGEEPTVLREVVGLRMRHALDMERPLLPQTVAFWNRLVEARGLDG